ncbi:DUF1810 domain-containing protein [uncultured Phenylobacterium sp.]|uniref:DUF1810 domain-containing protein n=1 Tax=uncultured Phenylobacterium sp. TaxID=349273 RepID=UPI0025F3F5A0|nr:DUF1810 domain-containing protein [uncultured Phenylobacterium sp.]
MAETFNLRRFQDAQDGRDGNVTIYERALEELRGGRKQTHWMWFVFPQLAGLGESFMAKKFGIQSLDEARAYLAHPVLGPRLHASVAALNGLEDRTAQDIFGSPDDLKLQSCLTLFARAADDNAGFLEALGKYYGGDVDHQSIQMLEG